MAGQLCWLPKFGSNGKLALHLRLEPYHPWKPHTAFPHLCSPDYLIASGTKGWATCQKLLASGWTAIPTARSRESIDAPVRTLMNLASNARFN
jgi:hypothetical protein